MSSTQSSPGLSPGDLPGSNVSSSSRASSCSAASHDGLEKQKPHRKRKRQGGSQRSEPSQSPLTVPLPSPILPSSDDDPSEEIAKKRSKGEEVSSSTPIALSPPDVSEIKGRGGKQELNRRITLRQKIHDRYLRRLEGLWTPSDPDPDLAPSLSRKEARRERQAFKQQGHAANVSVDTSVVDDLGRMITEPGWLGKADKGVQEPIPASSPLPSSSSSTTKGLSDLAQWCVNNKYRLIKGNTE